MDVLNRRITVLFDRERTIGHSFFLKLSKNPTIEQLADLFRNEIIPLLQEYFYNDYEKIQLVLGDNQKTDDRHKFIIKKTDNSNLFGKSEEINIPSEYYEINDEAFTEREFYAYLQ